MPVIAMKYMRRKSHQAATLQSRTSEQQETPMFVGIVGVEPLAFKQRRTIDEVHRDSLPGKSPICNENEYSRSPMISAPRATWAPGRISACVRRTAEYRGMKARTS